MFSMVRIPFKGDWGGLFFMVKLGKGAIAVFEEGHIAGLNYEEAAELGLAPYAVVIDTETCKSETAGGHLPGENEAKALVYFERGALEADGFGWLAEHMERTREAAPVMDFLLADGGKTLQAYGKTAPELVKTGYLPGVF